MAIETDWKRASRRRRFWYPLLEEDVRLAFPGAWFWIGVVILGTALTLAGDAFGWPPECDNPPDVPTPYITMTPPEVQLSGDRDA